VLLCDPFVPWCILCRLVVRCVGCVFCRSKDQKLAVKIADQLRLRDVKVLLTKIDRFVELGHDAYTGYVSDFCLWVLLRQVRARADFKRASLVAFVCSLL
jgi:hypothetical protein